MRNAITALLTIVVALISVSAFAGEADKFNTKVLFNGSKLINDSSSFSLVGTAVFPNIGNGPVLMMGGIGYSSQNKWGVKVMLGTFSKEQTGQLVLDIRASYDALDPIHFWMDVEYYSKTGDWYSYMDANFRVGNLGLIGVETENMLFAGAKDNLSFGPRVVLPLSEGRIVVIFSHQFHNNGNPNETWSRLVLNIF